MRHFTAWYTGVSVGTHPFTDNKSSLAPISRFLIRGSILHCRGHGEDAAARAIAVESHSRWMLSYRVAQPLRLPRIDAAWRSRRAS